MSDRSPTRQLIVDTLAAFDSQDETRFFDRFSLLGKAVAAAAREVLEGAIETTADKRPALAAHHEASLIPGPVALTAEQARHLMDNLDDDPTDIVLDFIKELQGKAEALTGLKYPFVTVSLHSGQWPFFGAYVAKTVTAQTGAGLLEKLAALHEEATGPARIAQLKAELAKLEGGQD